MATLILLDTCALIWLVNKDKISATALRAIEDARSTRELFLSPVSAWEIGALASRGRLDLSLPAEAYIARIFSRPDIQIAPLTPEIGVRSSFLPGRFHADPADRMLVTTAIVMGFRFVTRDRRILEYGKAGHLPVLAC